MALTICSECGHQISDKAVSCPHCGAPVEHAPTQSQELVLPQHIPQPQQNIQSQELMQPQHIPQPQQNIQSQELVLPQHIPQPQQNLQSQELVQPLHIPQPQQNIQSQELVQPQHIPQPQQNIQSQELVQAQHIPQFRENIQPQQFAAPYGAQAPAKKKTGMIIGIVAVIAVLVAAVVILLVMLLGGNNDDGKETAESGNAISADEKADDANKISNEDYSYAFMSGDGPVECPGKYSGGWKNGKPDGKGTLTGSVYWDGKDYNTTLEGEWVNGEFTGSDNTISMIFIYDGGHSSSFSIKGRFEKGHLTDGTTVEKITFSNGYYYESYYIGFDYDPERTGTKYFDPSGREMSEEEFYNAAEW